MNYERFFTYSYNDELYIYDSSTGIIYVTPKKTKEHAEVQTLIYNSIRALLNSEIKEIKVDESIIRKKVCVDEEIWKSGQALQRMWLSLTYKCNMNCVYCYEKENTYNKNKKMTKAVAKECIDYFLKYVNKKSNNITVNFFGGEPLLNKDVFLYATEYIISRWDNNDKKIKFILTTNGTLLDGDIIEVIRKYNMTVNLSIDGNRITQNNNRRLINGQDSFDLVMSNISKLLEACNNVVARVTVTKTNIRNLKEDILFLWHIGIDDVYLSPVETADECLKLDETSILLFNEYLEDLVDYMNDQYLQGKKYVLSNIVEYENRLKNRTILNECKFYNALTVMFSPEGDIYNCNRIIGDKKYHAGNVKTGLLWDKFKRDFIPMDKCHNCWARRLCGGGCNLKNITDIDCEFNKVLIKQSFRSYAFLKKIKKEW